MAKRKDMREKRGSAEGDARRIAIAKRGEQDAGTALKRKHRNVQE